MVLSALLGAGGIGALLHARSINKRTNAEANKVNVEAEVTLGGGWLALYTAQQEELNAMRERLVLVEQRAMKAEEREQHCLRRLEELESHARVSLATVERKVMQLLDEELAKRGVSSD